ncbi:MAG: hypothetical protein R3C60_10195 [Parvularculaceae bacterium]
MMLRRTAFTALALLVSIGVSLACAETRCASAVCTVTATTNTGRHSEELRWVPLLQAFDFQFAGNDRPPHLFAAGSLRPAGARSPRRFYLELADRDGNDRLSASARFAVYSESWRGLRGITDLNIGVERTVTRRGCRSSCNLTIPHYDRSRVRLVLTGFRFQYPREEHHLRKVGLWPIGAGGAITATFKDDDGAEPFDVTVSYVLLPGSWVGRSVIAYTNVTDDPAPVIALGDFWRGYVPVLSGFMFSYSDGDEHIKRIGLSGTDRDFRFWLQDNNAGNRVSFDAYVYGLCRTRDAGDNILFRECD